MVIERVITRAGSAGFNFRASKDGKVVANKREELSRILDAFQIHVDSPLTILTQDSARSFLQSSDPASLYKVCQLSHDTADLQFFMQGTLLQSLSDSYTDIQHKASQLERLRKQSKDTIPDLKEGWQRLLRKEKETNRMLDMRNELDRLDKELAWAYVADKVTVRHSIAGRH